MFGPAATPGVVQNTIKYPGMNLKRFILPATFLVAASQLLSRLLGVLRDHLFANIFGATSGTGIFQIDTYYAAFRLPDLVYSLLIFGTLSAAFVPLLAEKKDRELNDFTSNVLNTLLLGVLLLSVGIFLFANPLIKLITPGFSAENIALTAQLLRIQLLAPIFFTFSAVFGGLAQQFHKFVWYSLAPVLYNGGIILGALLWGKTLGVYGLSIGVALGAFLHAAIQVPSIFTNGLRYKFILRPALLKPLFRLAFPRVVSVAASQLQFVAITIFATLVGAGALAIFNYAYNLASLPLGVVGLAFATTSFAALSKLHRDPVAFRQKFHENVLGILFWVLPAAVGLYFLSPDITRLILAGGEFGERDIAFVTDALKTLAFAIPFISLLPLLNNAFFAHKNTRTPLFAGLLTLTLTVVVAGLLVGAGEPSDLALAYTLAAILGVGFLFFALPENLRRLPLPRLGKIFLATFAMGGLVYLLANSYYVKDFWPLVQKVMLIVVVAGLFYLGLARLLKVRPHPGNRELETVN